MKRPAAAPAFSCDGINHRLCRRIESMAAGELPELSRAILLRLSVATDDSGRAWLSLGQLAGFTTRPERALRDAIARAAEHPLLLLYVQPERAAALPWVGADGTAPPPDAWGFWLPDAALSPSKARGRSYAPCAAARALSARSVAEHIAAADAYSAAHRVGRALWPVKGEGLEGFLSAAVRNPIAANAQPDNDLPERPERSAANR